MNIISPVSTEAATLFSTVQAFRMEDGKTYNFTRWNGEEWGEWWEDGNTDNHGKCARPIYEEDDGDYTLIGIDF